MSVWTDRVYKRSREIQRAAIPDGSKTIEWELYNAIIKRNVNAGDIETILTKTPMMLQSELEWLITLAKQMHPDKFYEECRRIRYVVMCRHMEQKIARVVVRMYVSMSLPQPIAEEVYYSM